MAVQDRFKKANTIYKITKDLNLNGETLTIPAGCTLDFQGGSFSNGTIVGSDTLISNSNQNSFTKINFSGDFYSSYKNISWSDDGNISVIHVDSVNINFYKLLSESDYTEALNRWILDVNQNINAAPALYVPEGRHVISIGNITLSPNGKYKIYGNSQASVISYSGNTPLFIFNGTLNDWIEVNIESLYIIGNRNATLLHTADPSYSRFIYISDCMFESWGTVFNLSKAYNTKITQSRFFQCKNAIIASNPNGSSFINNTFLYNSETGITIINSNNDNSTFGVNIQGNTFEMHSVAPLRLFGEYMTAFNIAGNYFEPIEGAKVCDISPQEGHTICELTNSIFQGNYGQYQRFVDINGKFNYCVLQSNSMSFNFGANASVKSLLIFNHRFDSYAISGLTTAIRNETIQYSTYQQFDNSFIYNPMVQLVPITLSGTFNFTTQGETKNVITINSGVKFQMYNIQCTGVMTRRKLEIIDTTNNEIIYTLNSPDPQVGDERKPLFTKTWNDNNIHDLVVRITSLTADPVSGEVYITYTNKRYN